MEGLIQLPSKSFQVLNHGLCQLGRSISHPTLSCSKLLRLKNAPSERAILDHCCVFSVAHFFFILLSNIVVHTGDRGNLEDNFC